MTATAKKVKALKQQIAAESFVFRIDAILPDYSFTIGHERFGDGDYAEHCQTKINATCMVPKRFDGRDTTFTLLGSRRIIDKILKRSLPSDHTLNIGTLTMRGQQSEYLGSIPFDAALALPAITLLGGFRFIFLSGIPIRGGPTQINYMSFGKEFDPDDY
jgi:hypothetical protein